MAELKEIQYGKSFWHEDLDHNLEQLNKDKAETLDVIPEIGTVTLANTMAYPFSDAQDTVALETSRTTLDYQVVVEVVSSTGPVECIEVLDKQENGFKLRVVGSSSSTVVKYFVTGGFTA